MTDKRQEDSEDRLILESSGLPRRAEDITIENLDISGQVVRVLGLAKIAGTYTQSTGLKRAIVRDKQDEVIVDILPGPERGTVEVKTPKK